MALGWRFASRRDGEKCTPALAEAATENAAVPRQVSGSPKGREPPQGSRVHTRSNSPNPVELKEPWTLKERSGWSSARWMPATLASEA